MNLKQLLKKIPFIEEYAERRDYEKKPNLRLLSLEEKKKALMDKYERKLGYRMDIEHPKTFTEKLQWYKLYFEGDGHLERLVDKCLMKEYVKEKLGEGHTIPLIGAWTNIEDLEKDWSNLPEEFCLKSTLQSEAKCIKFIHNKSSIDFKSLKKEVKQWFLFKNTLANSYCRAYTNALPRVLAEQYLENVNNQLFDYKLFCFDGKPFCAYVAQEHFSEKGSTITFYDLEWNKLNVQYGTHEVGNMPKPKHWEEMIEIAKKLSAGFPHIRVDFFDTDKKLYVAELTLYPGGGYSKYNPESFNETMGNLFKLSIHNSK